MADFDPDEIAALATLARYLVRVDGRVSPEEKAAMRDIAREVGMVAFSDALERARDAAPMDGPELLRLARTFRTADGRVDAFRFLAELANADGIAHTERVVLDALAAEWRLDWTAE